MSSPPFNNNTPAWQLPADDRIPRNIYSYSHGEGALSLMDNSHFSTGRTSDTASRRHPNAIQSRPPTSLPSITLLSTPSSPSMFASLKASLRRKKSNLSTSSCNSNSADEREAARAPPSPVSPIPVELPTTTLQPPERPELLNPSPPTRRPVRAGFNAFTVASNEPPPAYTPSPTAASGPALGPSPAYTPPTPITTTSSGPEDPYSFLTTFDTVLLIDDSGSMAGRSWRETSQALAALLPTIVAHDTNGIDLYFLNHKSADPGVPGEGIAGGGYRNITTAERITSIFAAVRPGGGTPTGTRLSAILKPYLAHLTAQRGTNALNTDAMDAVKPLNILTITDGVPSDDVESVLLVAAKKLDKLEAAPHQIGVQFFQVGNEEGAKEALNELDDGIQGLVRGGVRDMVDTCTWMSGPAEEGEAPKLTGEGMLKVCLGSVVKRLDRRCSQEQRR
ncbi:hypothetical protein VC83_01239 [Pseudogymnoascus destructans]|uniref:VWFA domain-containing protein n=2 Tax=Pseudogymnoascus destructans TaxID=655981 RepID=L8G733_PSED2|nr:uncharacterized protein VC83_01239 [Pseudogymnoascus destructans]ELR08473.1 hypothetical protein GMDG_00537 [Pseudogymnoascus destructans 20631-21]OAF62488.1 hypothetical protein VC83_01239 [Pseudogymnoascus destructans]